MVEGLKDTVIETISIGDKLYNINDLTPAIYFDYVKNKKRDIADENLQQVAENCLTILNKLKITGQTAMAKEIVNKYELTMRELNAASFGFNQVIYRTDMEQFVDKIAQNPIKLRSLSEYKREIDDSVMNKLILAKENDLFDEYYVLFTDYTGGEAKEVAKHRREKDPILFGAFITKDEYKIPEQRLFYIGDWVDEYCDLTLEQMVTQYQNETKQGMIYDVTIPTDVDGLKEYFNLFEKKNPDKTTLLGKIKSAIKKSEKRKPTKIKSDE